MTEEVESPGSYETSASYEAETSYNATNIPEDAEVRIFESEGKQVITVNGVLVTDPEVKTLKNDGTDPDPEKYFSESE